MRLNADLAHVLAQLRACGYFGWRKPDIHLERSKTFSRGDLLMDLLALEARRFILAVTRQPPNGPLLCWFCKREHRYHGQAVLAAEAQNWLNRHEAARLRVCPACDSRLLWDGVEKRLACPACASMIPDAEWKKKEKV